MVLRCLCKSLWPSRWTPKPVSSQGHLLATREKTSHACPQNLTASGSFQKLAGNSALFFRGFYPFGVVCTGQVARDNCCPVQRDARSTAQRGVTQGKAFIGSSKAWSFKIDFSKQIVEEETMSTQWLRCGRSNTN